MKKIISILIITMLGLSVFLIAKDRLIKSAVSVAASKVIGAKVRIDGFSLGILRPAVRIKGFKLYNPPGFPEEVFVDIPKINVEYDIGALLKKKIHLPSVEFELSEVAVTKNKEGKLNIDELAVTREEEKKPDQAMPFAIDFLSLSIGRVVYKDFTKGEEPSIEIFEVNIKNKAFKNITGAQQLAALVLAESLKPTAIKSAKMYAITGLAGVSMFSPVGAALLFAGKDSAQASFENGYDKVYKSAMEVMSSEGKIEEEGKNSGIIKGKINNTNVTVKIEKTSEKTVRITVSARKYLLARPQDARGFLYKISQKLK